MKAKDVVAKLVAVTRNDGELPGEFADRQAAVVIDCALTKFRANVAARFPSGKTDIRSIVSLRREFTQWGEAIVRIGQFPWMRPTVGTVAFDVILGEVEKQATGGNVLTNMVVGSRLNLKSDALRMGI